MNLSGKNWYPKKLSVHEKGDIKVINNLKTIYTKNQKFTYAEFGIYKGATAYNVLEEFPNARVYLFDFEKTLQKAKVRLAQFEDRVIYHGNSMAYLDSYNWSLTSYLGKNRNNLFDYVFIDGSHVWAIDALTFMLCDLLLKEKGYIDFDDVDWTIRNSSLDPKKVRLTKKMYTTEQIDSQQVLLILDLLVRPSKRYLEVVEDKVFMKTKSV